MFAFPSYLSFPWSLPLPSLPSISLPANIQRRFLSYILKRSLGKFVKAGGLDAERIQAQISEGRVEIEGLEIDVDVSGSELFQERTMLDKIQHQVYYSCFRWLASRRARRSATADVSGNQCPNP